VSGLHPAVPTISMWTFWLPQSNLLRGGAIRKKKVPLKFTTPAALTCLIYASGVQGLAIARPFRALLFYKDHAIHVAILSFKFMKP
jgi:hypothetical protein